MVIFRKGYQTDDNTVAASEVNNSRHKDMKISGLRKFENGIFFKR